VYIEAMRRVIVPTLVAFEPDVVIISAGFDAFENDPLAGMALTGHGYAEIVSAIVHAAEKREGRVGMVLEGGYDLNGLEECVSAATRAMMDDGRLPDGRGPIDARHRADLDRAARVAAQSWPADS